jgi:hypothetical protein
MSRWEYKVLVQKVLVAKGDTDLTDDTERGAILNRYGQEGWELVSVVQQGYRRDTIQRRSMDTPFSATS